VGVITDVHADVHALEDALTRLERLGCGVIVCAGDLIDYGLFPEETIQLLIAKRIACIRGNHDRWALGHGHAGSPHPGLAEAHSHDASGWDLSPAALRYLASLPAAWNTMIGGTRIAVRHGSPRSDMDGIYPDRVTLLEAQSWLSDVEADVLLVGHTHTPFALSVPGGGLIANPGALLRSPLDPEAHAVSFELAPHARVPAPGTFGVLELTERRFRVLRAADGEEVEVPRLALR
jgi:predicted phosphodiesterase